MGKTSIDWSGSTESFAARPQPGRYKLRRKRRNDNVRPETNEPRINDRIRAPRVQVVDEEGQRVGEFMTRDALQLARDRGLDLVEVAPDGHPPVCRLADYGRLRFERSKKDAESRKKQKSQTLKEIKVRPKTDDHDMGVKVKATRKFLEAGNKVKITVRFRGREHAHHDIGADQCYRIAEAVEDIAKVEAHPRMEGRQMFMIIAPL